MDEGRRVDETCEAHYILLFTAATHSFALSITTAFCEQSIYQQFVALGTIRCSWFRAVAVGSSKDAESAPNKLKLAMLFSPSLQYLPKSDKLLVHSK